MLLGRTFSGTPLGQLMAGRGTASEVGHGIGATMHGQVTTVRSVTLGQLHAKDVEVALTPDLKIPPEVADGTLGEPFWANGKISFDYPHRMMCLELHEA